MMKLRLRRPAVPALLTLLLLLGLTVGTAAAATKRATFNLQRTNGLPAGCAPQASGKGTIVSIGPVEVLIVEVSGLPANSEFDLFITQVPQAPFGVAWYQGDLETDSAGHGFGRYVGRFSIETFAIAIGTAQPAPVIHNTGTFTDAATNVPFPQPVHMFHVGLWFNSPADAIAAGCPGTTTPFNGDHTAGVQVLNTGGFPNDQGPLRQIQP